MANWKKYKLGELADVRRGASPRPVMDPKYFGGIIPWIKIGDATATQSRYVESTKEFVTELGKSKSVFLKKGSLILSNSGVSAAVPHILGIDGCIHDGWVSFSNYNGIDPLFLFYWFKVNTLKIRDLATGSVFINLNTTMVKDFVIDLPPLPTQQKIAEILGSLDDKIELNLEMNKTLEEMAMAIYKEWFVDFGPFQDGEFVDSELGPIPKGWEVKKLNEITNISIGRTPPRKEKQWFSFNEKDVKWISIKDLGNSGLYILDSSEYLTTEAIQKFNVPIIPENTVVLSFKLTVGRVAITTTKMLSNEAIAHIKLSDNSNLTPEITSLFLKNYDFDQLGSTSSIATAINSQMVKQIKVLVPDDKYLINFQNIIKPLFDQTLHNQNENKTLTQTRDYLLPKLISGEVKVREAEELINDN